MNDENTEIINGRIPVPVFSRWLQKMDTSSKFEKILKLLEEQKLQNIGDKISVPGYPKSFSLIIHVCSEDKEILIFNLDFMEKLDKIIGAKNITVFVFPQYDYDEIRCEIK